MFMTSYTVYPCSAYTTASSDSFQTMHATLVATLHLINYTFNSKSVSVRTSLVVRSSEPLQWLGNTACTTSSFPYSFWFRIQKRNYHNQALLLMWPHAGVILNQERFPFFLIIQRASPFIQFETTEITSDTYYITYFPTSGCKERPASKADNLTAICEATV
jgi:hypothetical protein